MAISPTATQRFDDADPHLTGEKLVEGKMSVFERLFEYSPDTLIVVDPAKRRFVLANRMACLTSGLTRKELYATDPVDLIATDTAKASFYKDLEVTQEVEGHAIELDYLRKDGMILKIELHATPMEYDGAQCYLCSIRDLSGKYKVQRELANQEERWRSVVKHSPGLIITVDKDLRITFMNRDVWFTIEEGMGEVISKFAGDNYKEVLPDRMREVIRTGNSVTFESVGGKDTGVPIWYKNMIGPIVQQDEVVGATLITMDNTDQVLKRLELEKTQKRLSNAQTVARIGHWEWDILNDSIFVSDELYEVLNTPRIEEEIDWERFMAGIYKQDQPKVMAARDHSLKTGEPYEVEFVAFNEAGDKMDIFSYATVQLNASGEPVKLSGITQDVTRLKEVERALQLSQQSLEEAQQIAKVGNWEWHVDSDKIVWSDEFCRILGFEPGEVSPDSRELIKAVHPDDREMVLTKLNKCLKEHVGYDNSMRIITREGHVRNVKEIVKPYVDSEGKLLRIIGTIQDQTEQRTAEVQLAIANKLLLRQTKREQRMRSNSIIQGVEKERQRLSRELHDGIGQLLSAVKFTFGMFTNPDKNRKETITEEEIRSLIDMSISEVVRVSNNLMPAVLRDFGLRSAIRKIVDLFEVTYEREIVLRDEEFDIRLQPEMEVGLFRIVQESLNNAAKYSAAQKIEIILELLDDEWVSLEVRDDGKGFLVGEKEKFGNGILNMKERAEMLNGKFSIFSKPASGTVVSVQVPRNSNIEL